MTYPGCVQKHLAKRLIKMDQYFTEDNGIILDIKQAKEKN
jgi:hypothetical protein